MDIANMEKMLTSLIKEEEKYKRENDAKFRAIAQNAPTYDDFRNIVKASHLKPLESKDKTKLRANKIWNTIKHQVEQPEYRRRSQNRCFVGSHSLDTDLANFERALWDTNDAKQRYKYLQNLNKDKLHVFVSSDLCTSCMGLIFRSLVEMEKNISSFFFALDLLEQLTRSVRFNTSLSLLSEEDKEACEKVFQILRSIKGLHMNKEFDDSKFNSLVQAFKI